MSFEFTQVDNALVGRFKSSSISGEESGEFCENLKLKINSGHYLIIVDLSEVNFVDSTGLGAILSVQRAINGKGRLVYTNLQPPVKAIFKLTKMEKLFSITGSLEDAIALLEHK